MVECTWEGVKKKDKGKGYHVVRTVPIQILRHRVLSFLSKGQNAAHSYCKPFRHLHVIGGVFSEWHTDSQHAGYLYLLHQRFPVCDS